MDTRWGLVWPARVEWIARINSRMPTESRLIPDILLLIVEYGSSFILTWISNSNSILGDQYTQQQFCPWRDISQFSRINMFSPWAEHISGIATVHFNHYMIDLLSDYTWHARTAASALSRAHDQYDWKNFKTKLPRDAYVIYDMSLHGAAAIKNTMAECRDPIALAHHTQYSITGRISFQSDIF